MAVGGSAPALLLVGAPVVGMWHPNHAASGSAPQLLGRADTLGPARVPSPAGAMPEPENLAPFFSAPLFLPVEVPGLPCAPDAPSCASFPLAL